VRHKSISNVFATVRYPARAAQHTKFITDSSSIHPGRQRMQQQHDLQDYLFDLLGS